MMLVFQSQILFLLLFYFYNFVFIILNRTTEKTIADSLPIENLSENPSPREITKVSNILLNGSV